MRPPAFFLLFFFHLSLFLAGIIFNTKEVNGTVVFSRTWSRNFTSYNGGGIACDPWTKISDKQWAMMGAINDEGDFIRSTFSGPLQNSTCLLLTTSFADSTNNLIPPAATITNIQVILLKTLSCMSHGSRPSFDRELRAIGSDTSY
jgi:hypothetical protein